MDESGQLPFLGLILPAPENPARIVGGFRREGVAVRVETLELLHVFNAAGDGVAGHQAAGALGVEADDLVAAGLPVLETHVEQPP